MGIKIITGHTGGNHITAADDASYNRSVYGTGGYVLSAGNSLSASIIDNNTVRISSGDMLIQGIFARIPYGETEDVTIDSGVQGKKRNDIIVARYSKAASTGIESVSLVAIKGTATADTPYDPTVSVGNAESGANVLNLKLYRVRINGISIEGVDALFSESPPMLEMAKTYTSGIWTYRKYADGTSECWGTPAEISVASINSEWNGMYHYEISSGIAYPTGLFVARPVCTVGCHSSNFPGWIREVSPSDSITTAPGLWACTVAAYTATTTMMFRPSYHAIGRWK